MNKVTTVNLNGRAFQVEEQAYELLRAYLDEAARLLADDPDSREIMADLEQAIGDKGAHYLRAGRNVLGETEMTRILEEMGPVETGVDAEPARERAETRAEAPSPKRLYLVKEGEMIAGVCNGLAAYFGIDPTVVRLVFVILLFLSGGLVALAYLVLMFVVPEARTAEERAAARGLPFNAQELVDQAKRHYAGLKDSTQRWRDRRRRDKERAFWRAGARRDYEGPHSRPFDRPQPGYGAQVAAGIALPLIAVISAALAVGCVLVAASLLVTGEIFGWRPPIEIPPWAAIVGPIAAYAVATGPLRAVRYASYDAFGPRRGWFVFWDGVLWIALVVLGFWLVTSFVPGVTELFHDLAHGWRDIPFDITALVGVR